MLAAELGQGAPQFRLENDHQGDGEKHGEASQEPTDDVEVEKLGGKREADEDQGETDENLRARGAAEIEIAVVKQHGEEQDLDRAGPAGADKFDHGLHRGSTLPAPEARGERAVSGTGGFLPLDLTADQA